MGLPHCWDLVQTFHLSAFEALPQKESEIVSVELISQPTSRRK